MRTLSIFVCWFCYWASAEAEEVRTKGIKGSFNQPKKAGNGRRKLEKYPYYLVPNKMKQAPTDRGGAGRFRDPSLHDANTPPGPLRTEPPTSFPTSQPSEHPSSFPSSFPSRNPTITPKAIEFPVGEIENPGFQDDADPDDPEYEETDGDFTPVPGQPDDGTGGDNGNNRLDYPTFDFGPLFEDVPPKKIKGGSKNVRNALVESFSLGNRRLYGIASGENSELYISELLYGGILKVELLSGNVSHIVQPYSFYERPSGGLAYAENTLFVAGLGPNYGVEPGIHLYSALTGDYITTCRPDFPTGQIMDVTIFGDMAYATDAMINQIISVNINDAMHGICTMTSIRLPVESFISDEFAPVEFATGITSYKNGLIVSNYQVGGLFYYNFETGLTTQFVHRWDLPNPSGLTIHDEKYLFVAYGDNRIGMWKLKSGPNDTIKASDKGSFMADELDGPRSVIFEGNMLFTVNSRLNSLEPPALNEGSVDYFSEDFELVGFLI